MSASTPIPDRLSPRHPDPLGLRRLWADGRLPPVDELFEALGLVPTPWGGLLADEMLQSAGVWEGYTLGQHHRMVLAQSRRHFPVLPEGMDRPLMELTLALHDSGKAAALRKGGKHLQHHFTLELLEGAAPYLPVEPEARERMKALVDGDALGQLFKRRLTPEEAATEVRSMALRAALPPRAFLALLTAYYQADASSYTREAGGLPSLEGVFQRKADGVHLQFDAGKGRLGFNPENEALFTKLEQELA